MHGGTFTLKSKLRIGTEVIVTFPPERVMSALAPMAEEPSPPLQPEPTDEKRRARNKPIMSAGTGLEA
jgi:two-component system cell cycle sensor histidine kinase PleC